MSHTATIEARLTNQEAIRTACQRLELPAPEQGEVRFYDGSRHEGTLIKLPEWKYPVCVEADGSVAFDNYNGAWGRPEHLARFRMEYSAAVVEAQAGHEWMMERVEQDDGSLRLRLTR